MKRKKTRSILRKKNSANCWRSRIRVTQSAKLVAKSDVAEDTMSATLKFAKEIDEAYDIDQPTEERHLMAWL